MSSAGLPCRPAVLCERTSSEQPPSRTRSTPPSGMSSCPGQCRSRKCSCDDPPEFMLLLDHPTSGMTAADHLITPVIVNFVVDARLGITDFGQVSPFWK